MIRAGHDCFDANADVWTLNTNDDSVLCVGRYYDGEKIFGIFNFSEYPKTAWVSEDGAYRNMIDGSSVSMKEISLPGYGFILLIKK